MYVTAWSNGRSLRTGVGYGIQLSASDRDRYFDPGWPDVLVDVASGEPVLMPISSSFWRSCRELRSAAIGQCLLRSELAPWAPGHPPSLVLSSDRNPPVPPPRALTLIREEQVFRMTMYHPNHPDGNYQMANRVQVFDPPRAISWKPGYDAGDGTLQFGGWVWRYDLTPAGPSGTKVTLFYDWSAVGDVPRQRIQFPPFSPYHLDNSLAHLAGLVTA